MKRVNALRSQGGASLIEVILSIVFIFILVLVIAAVVGSVKDICVKGTDRNKANKLTTFVIESLLPLQYTASAWNPHLQGGATVGIPQRHDNSTDSGFLPASDLNGYSIFYTVTDGIWDTATNNVGPYFGPYKEIIVTTSWTNRNGEPESVSFSVLKRQQ